MYVSNYFLKKTIWMTWRHEIYALCLRDHEYWMMRKPILYDIHVEEYHVHRVMRQFGLY